MLFTDKIFGQIAITNPIIVELIKTPLMQRLKKIHQYGAYYLFYPKANNQSATTDITIVRGITLMDQQIHKKITIIKMSNIKSIFLRLMNQYLKIKNKFIPL